MCRSCPGLYMGVDRHYLPPEDSIAAAVRLLSNSNEGIMVRKWMGRRNRNSLENLSHKCRLFHRDRATREPPNMICRILVLMGLEVHSVHRYINANITSLVQSTHGELYTQLCPFQAYRSITLDLYMCMSIQAFEWMCMQLTWTHVCIISGSCL